MPAKYGIVSKAFIEPTKAQSISAGEIKNQAAEYEQVAGSYWEECKHYLDTLSLPYFPEKKSKTFKFDSL